MEQRGEGLIGLGAYDEEGFACNEIAASGGQRGLALCPLLG